MRVLLAAFIAVLSVITVSSCATMGGGDGSDEGVSRESSGKGELLEKNPAEKPKWTESAGYVKKGAVYYFVGDASKSRSEEDGKNKAIANALSQVSNQFGVKVSSELVTKEKEADGKYSYDIGVKSKITGAPIFIKNYKVEGYYYEKWDRGGTQYDTKVLIGVPAEEMSRIKREIDALTGWAVIYPKGDLQTTALVKEFAQIKKMSLVPDMTSISENYTIESLAASSESAYFLIVKISAEEPKNIEGEFYSAVNIHAEFVSLTQNKVISNYNAEVKGAGYSAPEAIKNGIAKAFEELMQQ